MNIPQKARAKIPNALTVFRLATGWAPGALVAWKPHSAKVRWLAASLFAGIALTDMLDGKLARKWHVESDFGRLWDPAADKELVGTAGAGLVVGKAINPVAGTAYFVSNFARDIAVSAIRAHKASSGNLVIPANGDGKKKMVLQTAGVLLALMPSDKRNYKEALVWACLVASVYYSAKSAVAYAKV